MRRNFSSVAQIVAARIGAIGCERRETDLATPLFEIRKCDKDTSVPVCANYLR